MESYQYTAFISYRHRHPDMEIAKQLHGMIENYHIPKSVQKLTNIQKMGRVFRDQEELPISTNLGEDIHRALENSQWLIVICTPELLKSAWCMKELDTFIQLGKRDHILAVLLKGEPEESFPTQLRTVIKNGIEETIEPLAADVRGDTLSESLKKLRKEKLRLIAPMLGLNYDALRQRAKIRQQKIRLGITSAALALVTAFSAYAAAQNRRIENERNIAWNNEMNLLIEKANVEVKDGNKHTAKDYLLQAAQLRERVGSQNDVQMNDALEYAMYTGLFEPVLTFDISNRRFSSMVFSENDKLLLGVTNLNSTALIDIESGQIRYTVSRAMLGEISAVGFLDHDEYFYMLDSWFGYVSVYRTSDGALVAEFSAETDLALSLGEKVFPLGNHRILIVSNGNPVCWNYLSGETTNLLSEPVSIQAQYLTAFHDGNRIAVGSMGLGERCYIFDHANGEKRMLESDDARGYYGLVVSGNDAYLAAQSGLWVSVFDTDTGACVVTYDGTDAGFGSPFSYLFTSDGTALVIANDSGIHCISVPDGALLWETGTNGPDLHNVSSLALSPDDRYLCFNATDSGVLNMMTGKLASRTSGALFSHDGRMLLLNSYHECLQLSVTDQTSTVKQVDRFVSELYKAERSTVSDSPKNFILTHPDSRSNDPTHQPRMLTDPNRKYQVYAHGDGFIEIFSLKTDQETAIAVYGEHCYYSITDLVMHGQMLASTCGYGQNAVLFDCETGSIRHVFRCSGFARGAEFSPDGTKLMLVSTSLTGSGDTADVYSVDTGRLLFSMEAGDAKISDFGFTTDGLSAVLLLNDGSAIVGQLYDSMNTMISELR